MIPAETLDAELEIKKSRFIARAGYISAKGEMKALVSQMSVDYPDARHYCWAYLLGNPRCASTAAMSDAGEPSGTAGKPILNVIQHKAIGNIFVIVARYFGGIKLGAGGLVRAYSSATEQALSQIKLIEQQVMLTCNVQVPFAQEQYVRHLLGENAAEILNVNYANDVLLTVTIPESCSQTLFSLFDSKQIKYEVVE